MDGTIYFGKIYIVEWLRPDAKKTGWELFDELEPMGIMSKPEVHVTFQRIHTRAEFIAFLRTIEADFRATRQLPLLHIEAHGSADGIGLSAEDSVLWPELMRELIPLNQVTQLRLLVVLAACEGFWGLQMLQPVGRAAFLVLLGPNQRIDEGPLSKACKAFYKLIFQNTDGDVAFKAMNDAVSATKQSFSRVNAEMAFKMAYRDFLADQCSGEQKARRVEAMAAQRIAQFRAERGYEMSAHEVAHERDLARQHVESRDEQFKHFRRQYFFIDLFPENDKRFPITLEDCED